MDNRPLTIGFSNLSDEVEFAISVRDGLQTAVDAHPNLRLIARDSAFDNERALANVREFAALPVDLAIIFHQSENFGSTLANVLMAKGIPIIAIDIPIRWTIFFGINNAKAGSLAGKALSDWVQKHWDGKVDKVLAVTEPRVVTAVTVRVSSAVDAFTKHIPVGKDDIFYIAGGSTTASADEIVRPVLARWANLHKIAVIGYNDDVALGVIHAAEALGRPTDIAVVGQGAHLAINEFKKPDTPFIASIAYRPEKYGEQLVELALRMLRNEDVPKENLIDPECLTAEEFALNQGK